MSCFFEFPCNKPTNKLKSMFTKHKDQLDSLDRHNVVYMIPCQDCDKVYIGETSKTIKSRITEHKNAIKRQDPRSLPATHVANNDHRFDWTKTTILNHADTRQAREFKEAWHSLENLAINRHLDIPAAYQQLQQRQNSSRGSKATNRKAEQNQPINVEQNQPIINQISQPIRHSLRLPNQTHIKTSHPEQSHTT